MHGDKRLKSNDNVKAKAEAQRKWILIDKSSEADPCDCPYEDCPGCWYPCETCGSRKCSAFCRKIRKDKTLQWARTY